MNNLPQNVEKLTVTVFTNQYNKISRWVVGISVQAKVKRKEKLIRKILEVICQFSYPVR